MKTTMNLNIMNLTLTVINNITLCNRRSTEDFVMSKRFVKKQINLKEKIKSSLEKDEDFFIQIIYLRSPIGRDNRFKPCIV